MPPAPAGFDEQVIHVGAIGQTHIGDWKGKEVLVIRLRK
jgi:hypothetical protein